MMRLNLTNALLSLLVMLGATKAAASVESAQIGFEPISVEIDNPSAPTGFTVKWAANSTSIFFANVNVNYRPDEYDSSVVYLKLNVMREDKRATGCSSAEALVSDWGTPPCFTQHFDFDAPLPYNGSYSVSLPRGLVTDTNNPDDAHYVNDDYTVTFDVTEGLSGEIPGGVDVPEGKLLMDFSSPDESEIPEEIVNIRMHWVDADGNSGYWIGAPSIKITAADGSTFCLARPANETDADSGKNLIIVNPDAPLDMSGKYYVVIPEGAIGNATTVEGSTAFCDASRPCYTVKTPYRHVPIDVYPRNGSTVNYLANEDLRSVVLEYASAMQVNPEILPYFLLEDGSRIEADATRAFNLEEGHSVICDFYGYDDFQSGQYKFILPRGAVVNGERFEATFHYIGKPEAVEKEEPVELSRVTISVQGGHSFNLLDPACGLDYVNDESTISIVTTYDDICDNYYYRILDVTGLPDDVDPDDATPVIANYIKKAGNAFFDEIYTPAKHPFKFSEGKEYQMVVECYSNYTSAMRKYEGMAKGPRFEGGAPGFNYSPSNVVNVTPAPGGELSSDYSFHIRFDIPVDILLDQSGIPQGQNGKAQLVSATPDDESREWTIVLPADVVSECAGPNSINVRLAFADTNGLRVRPKNLNVPDSDNYTPLRNMGEEENSTICVWYGTYAGCASFEVKPAPGMPVEKLYDFEYTYLNGMGEINPSWMCPKLNLVDEFGNVAASMVCDDPEEAGGNVKIEYDGDPKDFDSRAVKVRLHLDKEVTTPGTYTLNYPYNYFSMGREMDASNSRPVSHSYVVKNSFDAGVNEASNSSVAISGKCGVIEACGMQPDERIAICDAAGSIVAQRKADSDGRIRIDGLSRGIYIVRLESGKSLKIIL